MKVYCIFSFQAHRFNFLQMLESKCALSIFPKTRIKLLLDDTEIISGPARSNYKSSAETSSQLQLQGVDPEAQGSNSCFDLAVESSTRLASLTFGGPLL